MVLLINACARKNSRTLSLAIEAAKKLGGEVEILNLYEQNLKPLDGKTLELRQSLCDKNDFENEMFNLAKQFSSAEKIVVAAPFWDLSFPAILKCYTENICVCGLTFYYNSKGIPESLCKANRLVYVTTAGGFIPEENHGFDYIRQLSEGFFGIKDFDLIGAEGLDIIGADVEGILAEAKKQIEKL